MSAAYDPLGLGIAGIGYGGFAEGYSVNGVDLTRGSAGQRSADGSTSSYKAATPAQRRKLLSDLVDLLEKHRAVHSFEQFVALSTVDLRDAAHALLLDDLSRNAKVTVDAAKQTITYRPTLPDVHNRADILRTVQRHPFGLAEAQLLDAYHGVQDDVHHLVQTGQIYHLRSADSRAPKSKSPTASTEPPAPAPSPAAARKDDYSLLFPRHRALEVAMDPALVAAWHAVAVPYNAADLDDVLVRAGLMSERQMKAAHLAKSALAKLEIKTKRKKEGGAGKRKRYRQTLTNTHLLDTQGYQWLKQQQPGGGAAKK